MSGYEWLEELSGDPLPPLGEGQKVPESERHVRLLELARKMREGYADEQGILGALIDFRDRRCQVNGRSIDDSELLNVARWAVARIAPHPILVTADGATVARSADEDLGLRWGTELPTAAPEPLLFDRLPPRGHSILFGPGGSGKGVLAAAYIVRLVALGHRVLVVDYEDHPDEWGRRLHGLGGDRTLEAVGYLTPTSASWQGPRGPIWAQAAALATVTERHAFSYLVIDSIVFACPGADPSDPGTVSNYAAALGAVGLPALSLAHVPKAGRDLAYPFGSAFWHNQARMTWSLEPDGDYGLLTMRKANNYRRVERARVTVSWFNDRPIEATETPFHRVLADRIRKALEAAPLTVKEIVNHINEHLDEAEHSTTQDTVRRTLNRNAELFEKEGERWRLL